jgi:hypothetical protein
VGTCILYYKATGFAQKRDEHNEKIISRKYDQKFRDPSDFFHRKQQFHAEG